MEPTGEHEWQAVHGFDEHAPPALPRRATIAGPAYDNNQALFRQRRTSIVACERCRRRKIRCSGQQPCATCARFGVRCTKPEFPRERNSGAEYAALVDRVRMLESRLAMNSGDPQHPSIPGDVIFDGLPSLRLDTGFPLPENTYQAQDSALPASDSLSLSIPTIQITGPQNAGSMPSSPLTASPAPSLFSGTSRSSTPDPYVAVSAGMPLMPDPIGTPLSPGYGQVLQTPHWPGIPSHGAMLASPDSPYGQAVVSRRSSMSSYGGSDRGYCALDVQNTPFTQEDWSIDGRLEAEQFLNAGLNDFEVLPTKDQAVAWADFAIEKTRLPLEENAIKTCIQAIYDTMSIEPGVIPGSSNMLSGTSFSIRMARCIAFLVVSIGNKVSGKFDTLAFESCYGMAHEQMRTSDFWAEKGAKQVSGLLRVLAEVSW